MQIKLYSSVGKEWSSVYDAFDRRLFEFLLPPGARLLQFDGSRKGDIVHLVFPFGMEWKSRITFDSKDSDHGMFIDEGVILPFGIKEWQHEHHVFKQGEGSRIEDRITFSTGNRILDILYYPFLYLSFLPRVRQYKKYFQKS